MNAPPQTPPEKLAPNSPESEQAVLCSILMDSNRLFDVSTFLQPVDFFIVKNRWVFEAILALSEAHQSIDSLTVTEKLRNWTEGTSNRLDLIGGSAYLAEILNGDCHYYHIETYAKLVQAAAIRRRLLAAASAIAQTALEENAPIETIIDKAESTLYQVTERHAADEVESAGQIASRYYDQVESLYQKKTAMLGIPTGFNGLDQKLSGLQKGLLYVIGAPPGVGKTALTLHFAMHQAKQNIPSLFLSLEMSPEQLINRLIGSSMNLNTHDLQVGNLDDDQWKRFTDGLADVRKWPLMIDANPDLTIARLRGKARRLKHQAHIQAVYVDYLQLMHEPGYEKSREQEISAISRGLKLLAKELDIPVVVCAQLNRDVEKRADHRPQLSDLRESGAIEQNADVVMFLYRDDIYNPETTERPNQCDIITAKHRNGPTGIDTLYFRKEYTQFTGMERSKIDLGIEVEKPKSPIKPMLPTPKPAKPAPVYLPNWNEPKERDFDEEEFGR